MRERAEKVGRNLLISTRSKIDRAVYSLLASEMRKKRASEAKTALRR